MRYKVRYIVRYKEHDGGRRECGEVDAPTRWNTTICARPEILLRQYVPGWQPSCLILFMSTRFPIAPAVFRESEHPLARAFASFTEAAGSLERAYGHLQGEVAHLREELEVTNRDLASSLEENRRIRERLRRILQGLPCGVLVIEAAATAAEDLGGGERKAEPGGDKAETQVCVLNPAAVRLLGKKYETAERFPAGLAEALDKARATGEEAELSIEIPSADEPAVDCGGDEVDRAAHDAVVDDAVVDDDGDQAHPKANRSRCMAIRHAWLEESQAGPTSVFILRDVTEAKRLERDRESLRRQQALVEVSALLAHEIRNPLGSLELFAGLLAEANLEGDSHRWIEHVQAALRTLSATVNNVLHLHNSPELEFASIDAGELLDWAYDFLLPLAKQARVEMQLINNLHGVAFAADRHRLEQVLLNLALNAFRFMPGGGWLSLRGFEVGNAEVRDEVREKTGDNVGTKGEPASDFIAIEVRDTGPGIVPEVLSRVFEAGFSTRSGSSGLGLAVCQRIVGQHGGSIRADSRAGQGSCFRLLIPRERSVAESLQCEPHGRMLAIAGSSAAAAGIGQ